MSNFNLHVERDDGEVPDSLLFPPVAQWEAVARGSRRRKPEKIPHSDAVKMVESAMRDAQRKFDHLRAMLGFPLHDDRNPPRAA
jgi:hypothetical protein